MVRVRLCLSCNQGGTGEGHAAGYSTPAFVTSTARKLRLVGDYSRINESQEDRTFRMDQLGDLAAVLEPNEALFRADISDAYYPLCIQGCDREGLAFKVEGVLYLPLCLNCGMSVAPWFFTKAMKPVVAHLREKGHRVISFLDDFFGAARNSGPHGVSAADTRVLGDEMIALFAKLGLLLHPHMCDFSGSRRLEILGIVVDSEKELFLLSVSKLVKIEVQARRLLRYAAKHRRHVRVTDIRRFAGLGYSVIPAVVDARLRLCELFNRVTSRVAISQTAAKGVSGRIDCYTSPEKALRGEKGSRRLSHAAMRDLQWWARLSSNCYVGRTLWPKVEAVVFTDASMSGWGA